MTPQDVLVNHQRLDAGGCSAGCQLALGSSYADHVLAELARAGWALVAVAPDQLQAVARDRRT